MFNRKRQPKANIIHKNCNFSCVAANEMRDVWVEMPLLGAPKTAQGGSDW